MTRKYLVNVVTVAVAVIVFCLEPNRIPYQVDSLDTLTTHFTANLLAAAFNWVSAASAAAVAVLVFRLTVKAMDTRPEP